MKKMKVPSRSSKFWIFLFLVFLGVLALVLWLELRRQTPSFTIVDFSVPTSTGSSQHPDIHATLKVKNPNNVYSITYEYIILTVKYDQGTLGRTHVPRFHQPKKNEIKVSSFVEADVHHLKALLKAISKSSGEARLKVELLAGIRYQNLGYNNKRSTVKFQGQFNIGADGKISGKKKEVKLCKGSC